MKKIKIARVVTVPFTFISLLGLLDHMAQDDRYEVHLISTPGEYLEFLKSRYKNLHFHEIEIPRNISFFNDLKALVGLYQLYRSQKFMVVHSHTPKAGLLSSLASFLAKVPIRIHTFTGQVWVNYKGFKRYFFKSIDRLICRLNSINYADSLSQRDFLIQSKVGSLFKINVLLKGSFGGVDVKKFSINRVEHISKKIRTDLFPNFDGIVILYLGRINNDKGITELHDAFNALKLKYKVKLLIVGPEDSLRHDVETKFLQLKQDPDVKVIGFVKNTEEYIGACDIFCLPSYREGCPTSVIEASAMGKAVVVSNIYGTSDLIRDRETGLVFEVKNSLDLMKKIEELILNKDLRNHLGQNGINFVKENFSQDLLTTAMVREYERLIKEFERH